MNKKGFTLIELLAIIVILAIIAVITVPLILGIIDESKEQAAVISAYGYEDAIQKYYLKKVLNDVNQELPTGTFNITLLPSDFGVSGEHPSEGCVQLEKGRVIAYSLKFNDYLVTKSANGEPTSEKNGEISENSCPTQNNITLADITVNDYGQYIDIGTNILDLQNITLSDNTNPESDWRIFSKDSNGVWLMLSDYLPVGDGTIGASIVSTEGLSKNGTYVVYPFNNIARFNGDWSSLISGSDVSGTTGVQVKGAVDLQTWVASWNSNAGYTYLYTRYINTEDIDNNNFRAKGYGISDSEPVEKYTVDLSQNSGYDNTLYYPHKSVVSGCNGYSLSESPPIPTAATIGIGYNGIVGYENSTNISLGVRPVVYLPSSTEIDTSGTVWTIVQ